MSSSCGLGRFDPRAEHGEARTIQNLDDLRLRAAGVRGKLADRHRHIQKILAGELLLRIDRRVAVRCDPESALHDGSVRAEQRIELPGGPQIESALRLVRVRVAGVLRRHAVGIFGRIEAAGLVGHLAHDVPQRVLGDLSVERIAGRLSCFGVRKDELRLVVQHLLEVRHAPGAVHGIAMKPAADMVAHAAERHGVQRGEHHRPRRLVAGSRVLPQQKQELARARELRRVAKPPAPGIKGLPELIDGALQRLGAGHAAGRPRTVVAPKLAGQRLG